MYVKLHANKNEGRVGQSVLRAYNWGTYVLSYPEGPSIYETRSMYPARPMTTACFLITPHHNTSKVINGAPVNVDAAKILIEEIDLTGAE